ncbi:MAG: DUF1573 domain-containing protein [Candidatus Kapabacteria bacterium]|nr:DUF1573 domain-containing protein [Candidatus Kapabacteria bacterium]
MKKSIIIFAALILSSVVIMAQPKIEIVGGTTKNWGTVAPADSPLKYDLIVKNSGNQNLKISNVRPTCGCTTAPLEKDELKPNESTKISITFNVSQNSGPVQKQIMVYSNDPVNPSINYTLMAEVVRPLTVSPSNHLSFRDLVVGSVGESTLKIKNTSNRNITMTDFKTTPSELTINLSGKKRLRPGEEIELKAKVLPLKTGNLNTRISIKTDHPDFPQLEIHGFGRVGESPIFNNR